MELLERERLLGDLTAALERAGLREGSLVVLEGPGGVGKTALLERAAAQAKAAGFLVFQARAVELERDLAFAVVRGLLSRAAVERGIDGAAGLAAGALGVESPRPAGGDPLAAALHGLHALCSQLAERRPMALVVDDAHWADPASLRFLAYLGRRVGDLPVLLLVAARSHEPAAPQELLDALLHDCGAEVLRPGELSPAGSAALLREHLPGAAADLCTAAHTASGGNPFLIGELARELTATRGRISAAEVARIAPRTVTRSVLVRIGRLSAAAQQVGAAVALFPDGAPFRHVAALAGLDDATAAKAADELSAAGVLRPGRPLVFVHPLMRTAVYEDLPAGARAQAHGRAAALLVGEGAAPEAVATHLLATEPGARPDVVEVLRRSAESALAVGASEAAARYLRRALDEPPPEDVRAPLLRELGLATMLGGEEEAIEHLTGALVGAQPGPQRAAIAVDLARALAWAYRSREAVDAIDLAIADVEGADPDLALRYHAEAMWLGWSTDEGHQALRERLARLPEDLPGDTVAQQLVLCFHAMEACAELQPRDRIVELARRAIGDGRLPALGMAASGPVSFAVHALAVGDRLDEARTTLAEVTQACSGAGELVALPLSQGFEAWLATLAGDLAEAEAHALAARDAVVTQPGHAAGAEYARNSLLRVLTEQGRLDEAAAQCPVGDLELTSFFSLELLVARARLRLARGELAAARVELERAHCWAATRGFGEIAYDIPFSDALALILYRLGEHEAARSVIAPLVDQARRVGAPGPLGWSLAVSGMVADGEEERLALLEAGVASLERSPRKLLLARALIELGAALRRAGRRVEAREPLRTALELGRQCAAPPVEARAMEELRIARGRVRRVERSGPVSLTASEQRVAALAARGRTNREIAAELFLSVKTVEMHMGRVFRKLDLRSRRELPAALERLGRTL